MRLASDRIGDEGIIAFVTNNGFLEQISFDGVRKNLSQDFSMIYILNLHGDIRKDSMLDGIPLGEQHTVFGLAAMVGVSINVFIKKKNTESDPVKIFYSEVDFRATRKEKFSLIENAVSISGLSWEEIKPDSKNTWLTKELKADYDNFLSIGNKETKAQPSNPSSIFSTYSLGVNTNRDNWVFNYQIDELSKNIGIFIETYNQQVFKWTRRGNSSENVDSFVLYDDTKIKWSSRLKELLKAGVSTEFDEKRIRTSLYRPFSRYYLYFDGVLNHRRGQLPKIFPTLSTELDNQVICVVNEAQIPFSAQITNCIPCLHYGGRQTQCFPFYTYDEDGTNRKENITDWALEKFQTHYQDPKITKWDIFHYTYALLHHPHYRDRYAANLKRELPRIPFAPVFHPFATAGKRLTEIHINYEQQPEYRLKHIENKDLPIDWRVEKMRLSKDKTQIKYNDFLTLTGIPPETFEYKLGNRSALDWIIDQYQVSTDKRSGITNDPNRLDDEEYIVRLIKQVITVSLETVKIVKGLPDLGLPKD
jgi:predicted helicase